MAKEDLIKEVKDEWKRYVDSYSEGMKKPHLMSATHVVNDLIDKAAAITPVKYCCCICNYDYETKEEAVNCCSGE